MRHGKKFNHLGRTASHRKAMLANMGSSLIEHKRIHTTVTKAKALRKFIEPLITKSKLDNTHNRRQVFAKLKSKHAVTELFREVAQKIGERPGGYTRIIKLGNRLGDNAEMAMIELVDYNEIYKSEPSGKRKRTRRSRRSGKKNKQTTKSESTADDNEANPKNKSANSTPKEDESQANDSAKNDENEKNEEE